eukprot:Gb_11091 [translate_table: standard]
MMGPQYPLRWESTGEQWWFATPVDWAAANGHFEVVRELLRLDGNLLIKLTSLRRIRRLETVWDDEATFTDAAKGRGLVAGMLLRECETKHGNTLIDAGYGGWLLYTAAAAGDIELIRDLLKREPLLVFGEGEYGVTDILYAAARSKNLEIFREILFLANDMKCFRGNEESDAEVDHPSLTFQMLNRAVHAAARGGCVEMLKELLMHCLDVASCRDSRGSTPLHSAASKGQVEVVKELLLVSPDIITSVDDQGNTPLHVAAYRGHLGIVKQLLAYLPFLLTAMNNDGNTVLHLSVAGFRASGFRRLDKQLELVRHLVSEKTIDLPRILNCKNKEGRTAMHMAVLGKVIHEKLVELLLLAPGLDVNVCDKNGMTAVDILELNLLSGITSEPLLKQLASAGGRAMRSRDLTANNINISRVKNQGPDNSPGTSFRATDTDIILYKQFEGASGQVKIVEELSDKSSRRLSACPNVDCHDRASFKDNTIKYYIGNQKQLGSVNQAKQRLATLLGWSHGQSSFGKQDKKMENSNQDTETRSKTSAEEEASAQIMHTKEWLHHRRSADNPSPLRQRFSKASVSGNKSHSFDRKTPPSPSAKRRLTALCAQDIDQVMSPMISPFTSPLKSVSQSPILSPSTLGARIKYLIHSNGPMPLSYKPSEKAGAEDNAPADPNSRLPQGAMNQYFCFGIRGMPTENQKLKHSPVPLYNDSCRNGQFSGSSQSPRVVSS